MKNQSKIFLDNKNDSRPNKFRPIDLDYHPSDPDRDLFDLNTKGYRTKEFIKDEDLLVLGCSQTFGWGIDKEQSWPEIISNQFNISVTNLSLPGDSAQGQILKAFDYFKIYGNPKKIVGVFPIDRLLFPSSRSNPHDIITWDLYKHSGPEKFSQIPHTPDKVFNVEVCQIQNYMFISMLEQYCRSNNIEFFYTFWNMHRVEGYQVSFVQSSDSDLALPVDLKNLDFFRYLKRNSKSYFDPSSLQVDNRYPEYYKPDCHEDLMHSKNFYYASDATRTSVGHFSFHEHLHYADKVSEILGLHGVLK